MVNIKDVGEDDTLEQLRDRFGDDGLILIFARQLELMEKYHPIEEMNGAVVIRQSEHGHLDNRFVQMRIKDMMWRITEEIGEAANTLKNKPWKQDEVVTDADHYYEEIADAFHFFVELCIISGIDAGSLFNIYFKKSMVNKFRQRSGY